MSCAACGADNREGREFCGSCGQPLASLCAACGGANEPGERFCGECGSSLAAAAAASLAPTGPAAERRLVTMLFAEAREIFERLDARPWLERAARSGAAVPA